MFQRALRCSLQECVQLGKAIGLNVQVHHRLPQHVHQLGVVRLVHLDLLRDRRIDAEVGHADHRAPRLGPLHHLAVGLRGLLDQHLDQRRQAGGETGEARNRCYRRKV